MNHLLPVLLCLCVGCGAEPVPVTVAPVVVPQLPHVPFEDAAIQCCGNERVRRIVAEYLDLQRALADDDLALSQAELQALRGVALAAADDDELSVHSRGMSKQVAGMLEPVADGSLDKLRRAFVDVSAKVIVLTQANQGGSKPVAVAFCPQTNANWLQGEPEILNPFLGSLDPSSGTFRR